MKKILGLDLGSASIGWALVHEANNKEESSEIIKTGVRVVQGEKEKNDFLAGKAQTDNQDRTTARGARRRLQRYKLRREKLLNTFIALGWIPKNYDYSEQGKSSTFTSLQTRAKAAAEQVTKEEFVKTLLAINKKRGYKSNRKANDTEDGELIDGMEVAKLLAQNNISPAQFALTQLDKGKVYVPQFYKSDLQDELNNIWLKQQTLLPDFFTPEFKKQLTGKGKTAAAKLFLAKYRIYTFDFKGVSKSEKRRLLYQFRVEAAHGKLEIEKVASAITELVGEISSASGYLAEISDRGKELYFKQLTIGQYLYQQLKENPNAKTRGQVFYRQDYTNEFNVIWDKQAEFYPELTTHLKNKVGTQTIFYQRRLKSQKGLIGKCELEGRKMIFEVNGKKQEKIAGPKVIPLSSPLYQEYRIWQRLNDVKIVVNGEAMRNLSEDQKWELSEYLNIREKLTKTEIPKILGIKPKDFEMNFPELLGNRTNYQLANKFLKVAELSGQGEHKLGQLNPKNYNELITETFKLIGANEQLLNFDATIKQHDLTMQPAYQLWHLLYSYEGDNSPTGNNALYNKLKTSFGFDKEYAQIIAGIAFEDDYGSLSAKAIHKLLPFFKQGLNYSDAASAAGYNHSKSKTKQELANRQLKPALTLLPKNSLRNPVVEKILNQMVNVVNTISDQYGKPDEIRVELARELKKSVKERDETTRAIAKATKDHNDIRELLKSEFGLTYVSRKDIIKYKLYKELKPRGYKTLYSNTYIAADKLFTKNFDIEHIIPQSKLFDDSFSNKTLELSSVNKEKGNATAYDYMQSKYDDFELQKYIQAVADLNISKGKAKKLLMQEKDIPSNFIERDLRNSQYIAKKAKEMLEEVFQEVNTTTGSITDRLRNDWQLVDVLQELTWPTYDKLGLTSTFTNRDGKELKRIKNWTKRDDHRHHAMDAITVAFTKKSYIQYLNNLNAKSDKASSIYGIQEKELHRDAQNKLKFKPPMDLQLFRQQAKSALANTLISIKTSNKVVTKNINQLKTGHKQLVLTPRGQLHNETIYGSSIQYQLKQTKADGKLNAEQVQYITNPQQKTALLQRLQLFNNNAKLAFTGKNTLKKNPVLLNDGTPLPEKVTLRIPTTIYTKREGLSKEFNAKKIEKVIDEPTKKILLKRLKEYGTPEKAFGNLTENPVWFNKAKGIQIKSVVITAISKAEALHDKKDKAGNLMLDANGKTQPVNFVSTGNNHHVAIYKAPNGKLIEQVVSLYEAVARVNSGLPIIDKTYKKDEGYVFLFTLKTNELFVFPNEETGFDPTEIDLQNPKNYHLISPNLYRVQKFTNGDYFLRNHLETTINRDLKGNTFLRLSTTALKGCVKIRLNHIGTVVQVGEY